MKLIFVTPQERSIIDNVGIVTIPGSEGSFTVLNRHAPLISAIRKGDLRYDQNIRPIKEGVVEVKNDTVTVVTEN